MLRYVVQDWELGIIERNVLANDFHCFFLPILIKSSLACCHGTPIIDVGTSIIGSLKKKAGVFLVMLKRSLEELYKGKYCFEVPTTHCCEEKVVSTLKKKVKIC